MAHHAHEPQPPNRLSTVRQRWSTAVNLGLAGAAFGFLFPIVAVLLIVVTGTASSLAEANRHNPVMYLIELAPLLIGAVAALTGAHLDHTRRHIEFNDRRFRAIFDHAAIGIALQDGEGRFLESNAAFQQILGYTGDELRTLRAAELSPSEEASAARNLVRELEAGQREAVKIEKNIRRKDGTLLLCELVISRVLDEHDDIRMVGMIQDITARRQMETELSYQAWHDVLTGLANRARLLDRTRTALAAAKTPDSVAMLFIDLDGFKSINDSLGHSTGDSLIRAVSHRLLGATRGSDTVARLGGDEFAVLVHGVTSNEDVMIVARRIIQYVGRPITLDDRELVVTASVGIARGTAGDDADALLRNADLAMYRAKAAGRSRAELFAPEMHEAIREQLALQSDLRRALANQEFELHYQPIVHASSERIAGVESLIRWRHPDRGLLNPAEFIPVAEATGLILPIGRWVLRTACAHGAAWFAASNVEPGAPPPFYMTVNVSSRQLLDDAIVTDVAEALQGSGFVPSALVLEITEGVIMHDIDRSLDQLHALKALGVRIAVDDFGTGYSSLNYLQQLPIDVVKIDRAFIRGLGSNGHSESLVRTVIALADMLDVQCVAEGVEYPKQRDFLTGLGCHALQGYLYSTPVAHEHITALLHTYQGWNAVITNGVTTNGVTTNGETSDATAAVALNIVAAELTADREAMRSSVPVPSAPMNGELSYSADSHASLHATSSPDGSRSDAQPPRLVRET